MIPDAAFAELPLVAIIRGVRPQEVLAIGEALFDEGVRLVEVPLNSPDPLASIRKLRDAFDGRMAVGGGTMLTTADVDAVFAAGGQIAVSPNTDPEVIARAVALGMTPMPGFGSCSEAFSALKAGARYLKLFPASTYGAGHLKMLKDVLPPEAIVAPVGGVGPAEAQSWWDAGARGFGVGGGIYRKGDTPEVVRGKARALVAAVRRVQLSSPAPQRAGEVALSDGGGAPQAPR